MAGTDDFFQKLRETLLEMEVKMYHCCLRILEEGRFEVEHRH
jgi:hypothetical protein